MKDLDMKDAAIFAESMKMIKETVNPLTGEGDDGRTPIETLARALIVLGACVVGNRELLDTLAGCFVDEIAARDELEANNE